MEIPLFQLDLNSNDFRICLKCPLIQWVINLVRIYPMQVPYQLGYTPINCRIPALDAVFMSLISLI